AERRSDLQVQRGDLAPGLLRHAGGDRLLLGAAHGGRRRARPAVRMAEGSLRRLVAGGAEYYAGPGGGRRREGRMRDERAPQTEEARSSGVEARCRRLKRTAWTRAACPWPANAACPWACQPRAP